MAHRAFDITKAAAFVVIIRAIHQRGEAQQAALVEMRRRGLWLTEDQKRHAGIALVEG